VAKATTHKDFRTLTPLARPARDEVPYGCAAAP
jgi:hypothetical protein